MGRPPLKTDVPEWSDPAPPVFFADNYRRTSGYNPMEFYCGICGESLNRAKFSSHSLNHFHDVFEVRRPPGSNDVPPPMEPEPSADCMACREMGRKVRAMMEMIGSSS